MVVFCYDRFSQLTWKINFLSGCQRVDEGPMSKLCFAICLVCYRHRFSSLNYLLCVTRSALRLLLFPLRGQGLWASHICLAAGLPTPSQPKIQRIKLDSSAYKSSELSDFYFLSFSLLPSSLSTTLCILLPCLGEAVTSFSSTHFQSKFYM